MSDTLDEHIQTTVDFDATATTISFEADVTVINILKDMDGWFLIEDEDGVPLRDANNWSIYAQGA